MIVPAEYLQLRDALRGCPEYAQIPNDNKPSCRMFMHQMKDIEEGRAVDEKSLATMYGLALAEANRHMKKGRLVGIKLPEAPAAPAKSDPKMNNKQAALAAAPAVEVALGDAPAIESTITANDNTTAQAAPTPEHPASVEQQQEPVSAAAPAALDPHAAAAAPVVETINNATGEPQAQESPVVTEPTGSKGFHRTIKRIRVSDIKPNPFNRKVFTASLTDEGIEPLGQDIDEKGVRNLPEVNEEDVLLDGERRVRVLLKRATEWTDVTVVHGVLGDDAIKSYILDAYSSTRAATIEEKVNVYKLALDVLTGKHGRPKGRPGKCCRPDKIFWTSDQIRDEAAKKAGFGSYETVHRAEFVLTRSDEETRAAVIRGDLSINAAYERLNAQGERKPRKQKDKGSTKPKQNTEETTATTTAHADDDQKDRTQTDDKPKEKPASTHAQDGDAGSSTAATADTASGTSTASGGEKPASQAQDEQTSSTTSEAAASTTKAQETDASSTTEATRPSEQEQTNRSDANTKANSSTQGKLPQATPRQALDILVAHVRDKGKGVARTITREINDEAGLSWWAATSKPRDDLSALEDHVADRLEALADKDLDDAKSWLEEHDKRLWAIIRERVPRQEGDDRTDNSDYE